MSALVALVLACFSGILYFSQKRIVYEQESLRQATIAESLAQVAEESLLSGDDFSLINYTFKLKKDPALAEACVFDGEKYLSHTDKQLVRLRAAAPRGWSEAAQPHNGAAATAAGPQDRRFDGQSNAPDNTAI